MLPRGFPRRGVYYPQKIPFHRTAENSFFHPILCLCFFLGFENLKETGEGFVDENEKRQVDYLDKVLKRLFK